MNPNIKIFYNEKGMALVSALMLGLIGMLMVIAVLSMVDNSTWISGSKKRYQMALGAAHGGIDFFAKEIVQEGIRGNALSTLGNYGGLFAPVISDGNFTIKLTSSGNLKDGFWPYDPNQANTAVSFDATDATVTLAFSESPNVIVSTRIVSTSRGNSSTSSNQLVGGGVVNNNNGSITPQHIPYLYQTEAQGRSAANSRENAQLSALYVY